MYKKLIVIALIAIVAAADLNTFEEAMKESLRKQIFDPISGIEGILRREGLYGQVADLLDQTQTETDETVKPPLYVEEAFGNYKMRFGRTYEGEEHEYRLGVFNDNLQWMEQFNNDEEMLGSDLRVGITEFADLTHEEFKEQYLGLKITLKPEHERNIVELDESLTADSVDWRTKGAVTPVKNQEQCGSCWAFSAVASMEGAYFQAKGTLKSFSEQQLVDCSKKEGNHGCQGGLMDYAFKYAEKSMMEEESSYPYKGKNGVCEYAVSKGVFNTQSFSDVRKDSVDQLAAASTAQVVSVAIEADKRVFQHYKSGVIDSRQCGKKLDHGVTVVGFTDQAWIVKNSWGASWGDKGYVMIEKSREDVCGILLQPSYPKIAK